MINFSGTKTGTNLKSAFAGESKAQDRYACFAAKAKEEGHEDLARYFEETAVNEQEHAKIWLKLLEGISAGSEGNLKAAMKAAVGSEAGSAGPSRENLQAAINGESFETSEMYPSFAKTAREEGFESIARLFDQVANIEQTHAEHFKTLLGKLASPAASPAAPAVFPNKWKCRKCGNIVAAQSAPAICSVCENGNAAGAAAFKQLAY